MGTVIGTRSSNIVFLTTSAHGYTLRCYLEDMRSPLRGRVVQLSYRDFLTWPRLPVGAYVFADLDRLSNPALAATVERWDALRQCEPATRALNAPATATVDRVAVLSALHAAGVNRFRAWRLSDLPPTLPEILERPIFLRTSADHDGALTDPLGTRSDFLAAIDRLTAGPDGLDPARLVATEFIDVRNAHGHFERYATFRIGQRVFDTYYDVSRFWVNKGNDRDFVATSYAEREAELVAIEPFADRLRPIFKRFAIDYGRIDFAFCRDDPDRRAPQVFEINTNPMIETVGQARPEWRASAEIFLRRYCEAMLNWADDGVALPRRLLSVPPVAVPPMRNVPKPGRRDLLRRVLRSANRLQWEPILFAHVGRRPQSTEK